MQRLRTLPLLVALLTSALAGCGGDGDDEDRVDRVTLREGTFVGKVDGTQAFVAVVASPAARGERKRGVTVYVCDAKRLCEWFSGPATRNGFRAAAVDGDGEVTGELTRMAAAGNLELSEGKTLKYEAARATATAGLYDLTVSSSGRLRGASATGVGLTGNVSLVKPGGGALKLADGRRLKLDLTRTPKAGSIPLRAGQVRVIVLPDHQLRGVARTGRGSDSDFFVRSARVSG